MLHIQGMSKSFGRVQVLRSVSLDVQGGEVHALLGANGAGKSTLIKVLGGLYSDATGLVELDGNALDLSSPRAALRSGIGIVHQEFDLVPELSVAENIYLGQERNERGLVRSIQRGQLQAQATALMQRYDLRLDPRARVADLTVGSKQIVQIARVLALGTDVMIFDEPTARLGAADRQVLFAIFERLKRDGKKLVFVTHYLDEVIQVADRATVMRDGTRTATRAIADTSVAELSTLMVGDDVRKVIKRPVPVHQDAPSILRIAGLSDIAFDGIDIALRGGEVVGVVGHLGSGRHELTRAIISRRVRAGTLSAPAEIGFIPENRREEAIFPNMTVAMNCALTTRTRASLFSRLRERHIVENSREVIRRLQVKTAGPGQPIVNLSGGNQQKVVFGRAMLAKPELYIIEAPTVGVDVRAGAELHTQILALAERGAGILLSTDDLDEAILLSDRILVMLRGRIAREILGAQATRQTLIEAMGSA